MYLRVKIATTDPNGWLERAKELGAEATFYDQERRIFVVLVRYADTDIDSFLRSLSDRFPDADILEVGLTSVRGITGYRREFSENLTIVSPGLDIEPRPGEIIIESDVSFGSGYHPSTELCIKLIPEAFRFASIKRVFDLGTGSGVLGLCAAHLGAQEVIAADIDFRACKEARGNILLNKCQDKILVVCGSYEMARPKSFDLLLANLTIGVITVLAPAFSGILKKEGLAILSGFTSGQVSEVLRSLGNGEILKELVLDDWAGLLIRF